VQDNGIGIDPRHHQRVFGLFERLDTGVEGTGIGLALVKRIIEVHGGEVWVESAGAGQGSRFCFTVPARGDGRPAGGDGSGDGSRRPLPESAAPGV
jgi:signal transduction histidine kinase